MTHSVLELDPNGADPEAEYRKLRAQGPAARVDIAGLKAWAITDPALIQQLLKSPHVTKDLGRVWEPDQFAEVAGTWKYGMWFAVKTMFTASGDEHRRLRDMVAPAFSARRIADLSSRIEGIVAHLLDQIAEAGPGPIDLREHLCYPLPVNVISGLMGIPEDRQATFRALADALTLSPTQENAGRMYAFLEELIEHKRDHEGDDLTSQLIAARDVEGDGSPLTHQELLDTLLLVFSAGFETTVNVLDWAFTNLLTHPDQRAHIGQPGRATWRDAVEETLRLQAPVPYLPLRGALKDFPLAEGETIAKGDAILIAYGAANRDPDVYGSSADRFDITRTNPPSSRHLAFGHGPHACLGASLARMQAEIVLRAFFERFPGARLGVPADQLRLIPDVLTNGHAELPVLLEHAA